MVNDDSAPWSEYRRMVVSELIELKAGLKDLGDKLDGRLNAMAVDLITLKVKAGVFGAIGGLVFGGLVSWVVQSKP